MKQRTHTHLWPTRIFIVGLVVLILFLVLYTLQTVAAINQERTMNVALLEEKATQLEESNRMLSGLQERLRKLEDLGNGVRGHGALRVENTALTDSHGEAMQLRGMSTHGIMWYPQYTNAGAFQTVREYGGNVIRLALYSDQNQGYIHNPQEATATLLMAIENALSQDLYVIVDWHVLRDEDPNLHKDAALELFTEVSKRYGNHPGILYEICNEPNTSASWESVTTYVQQVIPTIRQNAPDAVILVGTPNYCTDLSDPMESPLPFENVLYSYHQYTNTMDEASYKRTISEALSSGLPIFVTEWGISNNAQDMDQAFLQATSFLDYLDSENISWINWSLCNKEESSAALNPEHDTLSGWGEQDFSPSGQFVFSRLSQEAK